MVKRDEDWIRCKKCRHKLGRMVGVWKIDTVFPALEVKCHSCGTLNIIGGQEDDRIGQARDIPERA